MTLQEKIELEHNKCLKTDCIRRTPTDSRCGRCPAYRESYGLYFCDVIKDIQQYKPVKRCVCGAFSFGDRDYCWDCGENLGGAVEIYPRLV